MKQEIILIRGLPGSGKTTIAKQMRGYIHLEADMFFEVDGDYIFDSAKVKDAHNWCVASAKAALDNGHNVVVSNTFAKIWEMERYTKLGYPFKVIEAKGTWVNVHGVPEDKIEMMKVRWEQIPDHWPTWELAEAS